MLPQRLGIIPLSQENNSLWISWHDSNWIPILNPTNVMDYFSEKSNPFYDRTCNNEIVKMQQRQNDQLNNMIGMEYILLHVQDPILYVIRKQHRHSPTEATPIVDYYIIAGTVYQAPDLASVFNSRLLSTMMNLQGAFEETSCYSRYHPNKGYSWDFSSNKALTDKSKAQTKKEPSLVKEEPSSLFQRQRVDMLLGELLRKFPLPNITQSQQSTTHQAQNNNPTNNNANANIKTENVSDTKDDIQIKQENQESNGNTTENGNIDSKDVKIETNNEMKPPPEKKMK